MSRVVQIPVPPRADELADLDRVDYADAFSVDVTVQRRPEEWLRVADSVSPTVLRGVRRVQQGLGLRLAPSGSADHPIGWTILHSSDDEAMLGAEGTLLTPRIVALTPPGKIVVATLLRYDTVLARMRVVALEHQATR